MAAKPKFPNKLHIIHEGDNDLSKWDLSCFSSIDPALLEDYCLEHGDFVAVYSLVKVLKVVNPEPSPRLEEL